MNTRSSARIAPTVAAVALAFLLAACKTTVPEAPPPPPPPAPPPITLAPRVFEEASAWRAYMARANAISPQFADGAQIASSLRLAAAYEPKQFLRGAVSYAAVMALQDPTYVAGIREHAANPLSRLALRDQIVANPYAVIGMPGAESAGARIATALGGEGTRLLLTGRAVKQAAYDVQHQAWSKKDVVNRDGRLGEAKSLSTLPMLGEMADVDLLRQASLTGAPMSLAAPQAAPVEIATPFSPLVVKGLAVAALAALGEAGEANLVAIDSVMTEPKADYCLTIAKLNLYQCLAVSKPHYEDVFCLGQHILIDTGQCMIKTTGVVAPPEPPRPVAVTPVRTTQAPARKPTRRR